MAKYIILSLFIFASCNQSKRKSYGYESESNLKEFFDFDEINYYHLTISENEALRHSSKEHMLPIDSIYYDILSMNSPQELSDTLFLNNLKLPEIKETIIDSTQFNDFRKLFREKRNVDIMETACEPIYRDILVFKKDKKITGIIKVCFTCDIRYMLGAKGSTKTFGTDADYKTLKQLLGITSHN